MRVTINKVNAALQAAGFDVEIVRGIGYWYFSGEGTMGWYCTSVITYHLSDFTVEGWVNEARERAAQSRF